MKTIIFDGQLVTVRDRPVPFIPRPYKRRILTNTNPAGTLGNRGLGTPSPQASGPAGLVPAKGSR